MAEIIISEALHRQVVEALEGAETWLNGWASAEPYVSIISAALTALKASQGAVEAPQERQAKLKISLEWDDADGPLEIVAHGTERDMTFLDARLKFLHGLEKKSGSAASEAEGAGQSQPSLTRDELEFVAWTQLYNTVQSMMAYLGAHGRIEARGDLAQAVMDALHAIDGGEPAASQFSERCRIAQERLPKAEYRERLTALHDEMQKVVRRYEHVRRLNPRQFTELFDRSLRGEGAFDDLVDAAIDQPEESK